MTKEQQAERAAHLLVGELQCSKCKGWFPKRQFYRLKSSLFYNTRYRSLQGYAEPHVQQMEKANELTLGRVCWACLLPPRRRRRRGRRRLNFYR